MVTTVKQIFHPLLFIMCYIIGLDLYFTKQQKSRWIVNLNSLYCLTMYIAYVCTFYYIMSTFTIEALKIVLARILLTQINIFTWIMFAIMSRYHRKVKFSQCIYTYIYKKIIICGINLENEIRTIK